MANDYHIYIHGDSSRSQNENVKPFSQRKDSAFATSQNDNTDSTDEIENAAINTGASSLAKVASWTAVLVAAAKVTDKVLTVGFAHLREYTGHYEYEMGLNNFHTAINHAFHPINYAKQILHRNSQYRLENQRIAEDSKLIGETIYNSQKIGV